MSQSILRRLQAGGCSVCLSVVRLPDEITVCLNLDVNTVAFRKNDVAVCAPQPIAPGAYHFVFDTNYGAKAKAKADSVTIVEVK